MGAIVLSLIAGALFGAGLALSQMVDPGKVLDFLDFGAIASGGWDPSLAFVMTGALAVTSIGYALASRRGTPLMASRFRLPSRKDIDGRLVAGAAIFGIGWGLAGYCPGPALSSLVFGRLEVVIFVAAMLAGMAGHRLVSGRLRPAVA